MQPFEHKRLERVRYWEGQLLRSGDFREIAAVEAQRRWWHNRAIHDAYGVREGFRPQLAGTPRGVIVSPGVAYDCFGRELVLDKKQNVPLPVNLRLKKRADVSLLIRHCEPRCDIRSSRISQVCFEHECVLATGTVEFLWKVGSDVHASDGVSVGRLRNYFPSTEAQAISGTQVESATASDVTRFDPTFRPAQPTRLARPLLVSGATVPGNTAWAPWSVPFITNETLVPSQNLGVSSVVDTSAAGFTDVPYYFASLQGSIWNAKSQSLLPTLFTSISDETLTSFTFEIFLVTTDQQPPVQIFQPASRSLGGLNVISDPAAFLLFAQQQNLYISWSACQMPQTSPPAFDESMALSEIIGSVLRSTDQASELE
jgi:hypothetical protein